MALERQREVERTALAVESGWEPMDDGSFMVPDETGRFVRVSREEADRRLGLETSPEQAAIDEVLPVPAGKASEAPMLERVAATWRERPLLWAVLLAGLGFGLVYFPMALLLTAVLDDAWSAFRYPAVLRAIRAGGAPYAALAATAAALVGFALAFDAALELALAAALPWAMAAVAGTLLGWVVLLYVALSLAYALGRLHAHRGAVVQAALG
jgi:hypothetical protein